MKFIHTGDIHWGMCPDANKPWGKERAQAIKRYLPDNHRKRQKRWMWTAYSSAETCFTGSR